MTPRDRLTAIWNAALAAVDAGDAVERALPGLPQDGRLVVLALGKAALPMAARALARLGDRVSGGLVVTKDGHGGALDRLEVREAGHPLPDDRSEAAARAALELARAADPGDLLLVLLSGGTSALTSCPAPGLSLADLQATTDVLLASGADIAELNAVRKHLSAFSGGRLAQAAGCQRIHVLAISDVRGDALDVIGSGPCAPDPTSYQDALDVLARRGAGDLVPAAITLHLERGRAGAIPETPGPEDPCLSRVRHEIVARNADARRAAAEAARERGMTAIDLGEILSGEARDEAAGLLDRARECGRDAPVCLIAGGETTVRLRGRGRGGRNQELALAAALSLAKTGEPNVTLLAGGTDGTDGPTDAAGALVDGETVARGRAAGADAASALASNDSYTFFAREGGALVTGPTGTNVMDLVLIEVS